MVRLKHGLDVATGAIGNSECRNEWLLRRQAYKQIPPRRIEFVVEYLTDNPPARLASAPDKILGGIDDPVRCALALPKRDELVRKNLPSALESIPRVLLHEQTMGKTRSSQISLLESAGLIMLRRYAISYCSYQSLGGQVRVE